MAVSEHETRSATNASSSRSACSSISSGMGRPGRSKKIYIYIYIKSDIQYVARTCICHGVVNDALQDANLVRPDIFINYIENTIYIYILLKVCRLYSSWPLSFSGPG